MEINTAKILMPENNPLRQIVNAVLKRYKSGSADQFPAGKIITF
jgi:hypothetical protein